MATLGEFQEYSPRWPTDRDGQRMVRQLVVRGEQPGPSSCAWTNSSS